MNDKSDQMPEPKACSFCGESFGCGVKLDGCWCAEVKIPAATAADLSTKFNDCLCPKCLKARAADPAIIVKYPDGTTEIVESAVRVDTQNFHEGMFDFYDERGNLLRQIDMGSGISWDDIEGA